MYDQIRDPAEWKRNLGDSVIPGVLNLADPVTIPVRKVESLQNVQGDILSNVQYTVFPEHVVQPKDYIDGAEIMRVTTSKDNAGNVRWRTCYGRI